MVEKVKSDSDDEDVVEELAKKLQAGVHLQLFNSRRKLVEEPTRETAKLRSKIYCGNEE